MTSRQRFPAMPILLATLIAVGLVACGGVNRTMLASPRAPVDPATVRLYDVPPAGSVQIAQIEATSGAGFGTQGQADAAVARLRQEAAKVGANGVVLMGVGTGRAPVNLGIGVGSYGSHGGGSLGFGIPTANKRAAGMAIWVPPEAVPPRP